MALTERQKRIVNPYASTLNTPERRGVGYDFNDEGNKFAIDAIHENYLYFFEFPQVGTPLVGEGRNLTSQDFLAYFSLYPQNGKLIGDSVQLIAKKSLSSSYKILLMIWLVITCWKNTPLPPQNKLTKGNTEEKRVILI